MIGGLFCRNDSSSGEEEEGGEGEGEEGGEGEGEEAVRERIVKEFHWTESSNEAPPTEEGGAEGDDDPLDAFMAGIEVSSLTGWECECVSV